MTFWFLLLKFHYPLELLTPSVSQLQHLLYATNIKLATDCNKLFCFLGLVGLYAGNWWDDISWKTSVWKRWGPTRTRQLRFLQGNDKLVVGHEKGWYRNWPFSSNLLASQRVELYHDELGDKSKDSFRFRILVMSCGALNMCSKCKTCLRVFPVSSLL